MENRIGCLFREARIDLVVNKIGCFNLVVSLDTVLWGTE